MDLSQFLVRQVQVLGEGVNSSIVETGLWLGGFGGNLLIPLGLLLRGVLGRLRCDRLLFAAALLMRPGHLLERFSSQVDHPSWRNGHFSKYQVNQTL